MDRRSFIKLTAITGTSATLASCGNPENHLIRFVPEDDLVPGIAVWKPGVCPLCAAGCGLSVRTMEADVEVVRGGESGVVRMAAAKKLEGSAAHPVNQGGLCPRGQAGIQVTYHPDRITQPLKRSGTRGDGKYEAITWDAALMELLSRLDALDAARRTQSLAFLARPGNGHRRALVEAFLSRFGAPAAVTFELFSDDVLREANALSFGRRQLPTFDLPNARFVISFGADFLGTWNSPVSQAAGYAGMRQGRPGIRGAFVQVEARMSQTGANADEWVPVLPGTEGVLALGLAHVIIAAKIRPAAAAGHAGALVEGWNGGLASYTPEAVEKITGVAVRRVERLARQFADQRPSVAMIAGAPLAHTNGLFNAIAVNALNALVGSVGQPGGMFFTPQLDVAPASTERPAAPPIPLESLVRNARAADRTAPQVLLIDGANPVFSAPGAWNVREAFEKISFIASFGSFLDETSVLADLILPDHSFLESWADAVPESGAMVAVASVAAPVMRPLHQTRAMPDVLLDVGRRLKRPLAPALPWQTFDEMLKSTFAGLPAAGAGGDAWTQAQGQGGWWGQLPEARTPANRTAPDTGSRSLGTRTVTFAPAQFDGDAQQFPFHFLPYPSPVFADGSVAHLPWLQELPDPLTSAMWSSWVEINPKTAERLAIGAGDIIEIASSQGTLRAPALISPGLAPDIVAMPVGQGHTMFTRVATGRGQNPSGLLAPIKESSTDALAWAATRVQLRRVGNPDGSLILFAGGMREAGEEHEHR